MAGSDLLMTLRCVCNACMYVCVCVCVFSKWFYCGMCGIWWCPAATLLMTLRCVCVPLILFICRKDWWLKPISCTHSLQTISLVCFVNGANLVIVLLVLVFLLSFYSHHPHHKLIFPLFPTTHSCFRQAGELEQSCRAHRGGWYKNTQIVIFFPVQSFWIQK